MKVKMSGAEVHNLELMHPRGLGRGQRCGVLRKDSKNVVFFELFKVTVDKKKHFYG